MNPSPLLNRTETKAILKIRNELTFQALLKKQWIPAAVGRYTKTHLWCPDAIYKLAERNQKMGISFSKKMTEDIILECVIDAFERQEKCCTRD